MSAKSFEVRGVHVLASLVLFFAAIIAINVAFAIAAVRTFPGEDERRSYTQGLHYNDVLAERRAQAALGWQARSELAATDSGARLLVRLADREGRPVERAEIDAVLRWPPNESGDRVLQFTSFGDGLYAADLGALAPGRWDLRGRARNDGGDALDFQAELTWPTR